MLVSPHSSFLLLYPLSSSLFPYLYLPHLSNSSPPLHQLLFSLLTSSLSSSFPNSSPIPSPPHLPSSPPHLPSSPPLKLLISPSSTTLLPPLSSPPLSPSPHLLTQGLNKQHKDIHEMGCVSAAKKWINRNLIPISAVIVGISLLQVWVGV